MMPKIRAYIAYLLSLTTLIEYHFK